MNKMIKQRTKMLQCVARGFQAVMWRKETYCRSAARTPMYSALRYIGDIIYELDKGDIPNARSICGEASLVEYECAFIPEFRMLYIIIKDALTDPYRGHDDIVSIRKRVSPRLLNEYLTHMGWDKHVFTEGVSIRNGIFVADNDGVLDYRRRTDTVINCVIAVEDRDPIDVIHDMLTWWKLESANINAEGEQE